MPATQDTLFLPIPFWCLPTEKSNNAFASFQTDITHVFTTESVLRQILTKLFTFYQNDPIICHAHSINLTCWHFFHL